MSTQGTLQHIIPLHIQNVITNRAKRIPNIAKQQKRSFRILKNIYSEKTEKRRTSLNMSQRQEGTCYWSHSQRPDTAGRLHTPCTSVAGYTLYCLAHILNGLTGQWMLSSGQIIIQSILLKYINHLNTRPLKWVWMEHWKCELICVNKDVFGWLASLINDKALANKARVEFCNVLGHLH